MTRLVAIVLSLAATHLSGATSRTRVEVMGLFHPNLLIVESAPGESLIVTARERGAVVCDVARKRFAVTRSGSNIQFETGAGSKTADEVTLSGHRGDAEFVLSVPGKLRRIYRGGLSVTSDGKKLIAVVEMDLETAVASIVAAESPAGAPLEALKAQAVVSRSYVVAGGPRHRYADFCDTTHCQFLRSPPAGGTPTFQAVAATAGLVLAWRGKAFPAMYSASCGGRTHSLAETGLTGQDYPFFAVNCPQCRRAPEIWTSKLPGQIAPQTESERIKLGRELGWSAVPSNTFTAATDATGSFLTGSGRGHGIGLCQIGASGMAQGGANFTRILEHYFPNTTIESLAK
jgi:stage II sporulation protein D